MRPIALGLTAGLLSLVPAWLHAQTLPSFIVAGSVKTTDYDGVTDDLLSGGLGKTGLGSATAPAVSATPTAAELRRRALHGNYRAIADSVVAGGYSVLWGPNVTTSYTDSGTEGLVAGREYLAYADDGAGGGYITIAVQIPTAFNTARPCIMLVPSSGSRGVYGGVAVGEWGLRNNCAVAYVDKGTGNAFHDLTNDLVYDMQGVQGTTSSLGSNAGFTATSTSRLNAFKAANPNRWATKHAHNRTNPESLWGTHVLQAAEFALYALNARFNTTTYTAATTYVIASGVSNGGGASLLAAEQDTKGLIDAVVVGEPQIQPKKGNFSIVHGSTTITDHSRPIYDTFTTMSLYAACASLDTTLAGTALQSLEPSTAPALTVTARANRCQSLADKGLISGTTTAAQAASALAKIVAYGFNSEANTLLAAHEYLSLWRSLQITYANAYGKFGVEDNLCGMSFAPTSATTGAVTTLASATSLTMFSGGSGVPGTNGINLVNEKSKGGAIVENQSVSPSTGRQDLNLDGAICFRQKFEPRFAGAPSLGLRGDVDAMRVRTGIEAVRATGNLRGKPAIIVTGRSDALVPINHHSRPYVGLNKQTDSATKLAYWEVVNANHFDAFVSSIFTVGGSVTLVPLHYYLTQALDKMLANVTAGTAYPPSQVIRPTARGTGAITTATVGTLMPAPAASPAAADAITVSTTTLTIPR